MPHKPLIALGIFFAAISGAMTPIFAFMLSRLLVEVSTGTQDVSIVDFEASKGAQDVSIINVELSKGTQDVSIINAFGGIIFAVAIADSLFVGLKFITLETAGQLWVSHVREVCYPLVLAQDKRWFDRSENAASKLCYALMYDGYYATDLISDVISQSVVIFSMLIVGLTWAFARGWQLTLVGLGLGLVFILTMVMQSRLVAKCEVRNRRAREEVSRAYYHVSLESLSVWPRIDYSLILHRPSSIFGAFAPWDLRIFFRNDSTNTRRMHCV